MSVTSPTSQTGTGTVSISVAENTGDARSATLTVGGQTVTVNQAAGDAGVRQLGRDDHQGRRLPREPPLIGAMDRHDPPDCQRQPRARDFAPVGWRVNQVVTLQLVNNNLQFAVFVDTVYTFVATLAADRRSLTGTFSGGSCSGTWTGARQ